MSTKASAASMVQALKELKLDWERTKAHWRDAKALQFEQTYIEELPDLVVRAMTTMQDIDALLTKVHNDCE